jgi:hypothetical protein
LRQLEASWKLLNIKFNGLLPCSEAGHAGEAAEVDDHIIDHGEQHATWSTWSAASAAIGRVLAANFKMHLTST